MTKLAMVIGALLLTLSVSLNPYVAQAQVDEVKVEEDTEEGQNDSEWKYVPVRRYAAVDSSDAGFDGRLLTEKEFRSEQ